MSSKSITENTHLSWTEFFYEHSNDQAFKEALFVQLYTQFDVEAKIISTTNKMPILQANILYDGNNKNVFDNPKAIKNIYVINLIHRVFAEYRGLEFLYTNLIEHKDDDPQIKSLEEIFLSLLQKLDNLSQCQDLPDFIEALNAIESKIQGKYAAFLSKFILDPLNIHHDPKRNIKYLQNCLAHTRFLSSLLDPAITLQVVIKDTINNTTSTYTAHPITQKTETQKQRIRAKKNVNDFEDWANLQFNPLLVQDNTQLPALCRSSHLHTLKNAYVVECKFEADGKSREWSYSRSASLTYIGEKYSRDVLEEAFRENVLQLQIALKNRGLTAEHLNAEEKSIEILSLTTGFPIEFMDEIKVSERTKEFINTENTPTTSLAYIPINELGTFTLGQLPDGTVVPRTYGKKHERIQIAANHAFNSIQSGKHVHIHCQSGWDRTSVIDTLVNIRKEQEAYQNLAGIKLDSSEIEKKYRLGLLAPILGDLVQSGSFGMKPNTKSSNMQGLCHFVEFLNRFNIYPTKDVFSTETNDYYYWDIAKTNRRRPINQSTLAIELEKTPADDIVKKSQTAVDNLVYDPYNEKTQYEYLENLKKVEEAGADYSPLLITLLIIFSIVMIAVGLVCIIPTGGSSSLIATLALIGLTLTLEYAAACAIGASALVLGTASAATAITWLFYKNPCKESVTSAEDLSFSETDEETVENSVI